MRYPGEAPSLPGRASGRAPETQPVTPLSGRRVEPPCPRQCGAWVPAARARGSLSLTLAAPIPVHTPPVTSESGLPLIKS